MMLAAPSETGNVVIAVGSNPIASIDAKSPIRILNLAANTVRKF